MKNSMIAELGKVKFVATSTDWSAHQNGDLPLDHWRLRRSEIEKKDMLAGVLDYDHGQWKMRGLCR